jgi:beta-lysine 5,6-aminomutase alpha subunit
LSKLNLDRDKVESCRRLAEKIGRRVQEFVDQHTTVSIERSVLRLLGVEADYKGRPLVNAVVDSLTPAQLSRGIFYWLGRALAHSRGSRRPLHGQSPMEPPPHQQLTPTEICLKIVEGKIKWAELPEADYDTLCQITDPLAQTAVRRLEMSSEKRRRAFASAVHRSPRPLKYLIVATGNIYEDVEQAKAAVLHGADCIAVIRSTAQSLLDYVPNGATTEGFGGTYATQENFKIMRQAMDEAGKKVGRHIRVVNYSSGLCMPEIAVMGAVENLDYLLNDSMYGILFRDINMKRTFTDQYFSRLVIARSGIVINTGEDNYLTTAESFRAFPQVLASQFINEQMGLIAHLREEQLGLGHAFEMDPKVEDSLLHEIAQAATVREIFPNSPIKYMPPTRHMNGDIFFGHTLDVMFDLVGVLTQQEIQLLGMPTEGIHNPLLQDRFIALKSANYIFQSAKDLSEEISWNPNGKIARRSRSVLEDAYQLLLKVEKMGLMKAISLGAFANMVRDPEGGRGLQGVIKRDHHYLNPILKLLEKNFSEEEIPFEPRRRFDGDSDRSSHPQQRSQRRGRGRFRGRRPRKPEGNPQ